VWCPTAKQGTPFAIRRVTDTVLYHGMVKTGFRARSSSPPLLRRCRDYKRVSYFSFTRLRARLFFLPTRVRIRNRCYSRDGIKPIRPPDIHTVCDGTQRDRKREKREEKTHTRKNDSVIECAIIRRRRRPAIFRRDLVCSPRGRARGPRRRHDGAFLCISVGNSLFFFGKRVLIAQTNAFLTRARAGFRTRRPKTAFRTVPAVF